MMLWHTSPAVSLSVSEPPGSCLNHLPHTQTHTHIPTHKILPSGIKYFLKCCTSVHFKGFLPDYFSFLILIPLRVFDSRNERKCLFAG